MGKKERVEKESLCAQIVFPGKSLELLACADKVPFMFSRLLEAAI